jgi:hypothetical protein
VQTVARITAGPLSITGHFGRRTAYLSGQVSSKQEADALTLAELERLSGPQVIDIPIRCHFHPLIEVGDVVTVTTDREMTGRVIRAGLSGDALMDITIRIRREIA